MIILIYGEDTYRSHKRFVQLREAFRQKYDKTGMNIVQLDGEKLKPEQFTQTFSSQGFLATRRFVGVTNFLSRGTAVAHEVVQSALENIQYETDNVIVFWEDADIAEKKSAPRKKSVKQDSSLLPGLLSKAKKERFPLLDVDEIHDWILQAFAAREAAIDMKAATQLGAAVGNDLWRASSEIEKLVHFASGRLITEADVAQLVVTQTTETVFALTDALGMGNRARALELFEENAQSGTDTFSLLRAIIWHFRNLLAIRSFMDDGTTNPAALARELGIHPYVAQKCTQQAEAFTVSALSEIYQSLVRLEQELKTSRIDPLVLFDLLTMRVTLKQTALVVS